MIFLDKNIRPSIELLRKSGSESASAGDEFIRTAFHQLLAKYRALPRSIGVASFVPGEGASTVAAGISMTAAKEMNGSILIVDMNAMTPVQHDWFGVSETPGWTEWNIKGGRLLDFVQSTKAERISILTAGKLASTVSASTFQSMISTLEQSFDLVIVDLPNLNESYGGLKYVQGVESVLWVIESNRHAADQVLRMKRQLEQANAKILGAILNKTRNEVPHSFAS